ncbi:MAG: YciI family protein [Hyphomicrobiales bacterium]|nr:YciI family protein [Hyphomicrobiales bacterium]
MQICRIALDAPGKDAERKALFEAHRSHLRAGLVRIIQSGPLFATDGSNNKIGALVVFDVKDIDEVQRFNAMDPYILHGVYGDVQILRWDKTIG